MNYYFSLQCLGEATGVHRYLPPIFGWSHSFPMKLKSEAHEALSLLFQRNRVTPTVICDNAEEMIFGEFNRKLKEASCHLKQTEPFTPWSNAVKREIKELKKGRSGAPKRLWDDYLELEFYKRSNTAHGIYKLDGEVHETIMSCKTSNISNFVSLNLSNG